MKIIIKMFVLFTCSALISGCQWNPKSIQSKETNSKYEEEDGNHEMTQQQEEIFRSYGITEDEIARMKREGLDYKEQSFVDTATIMLSYLEDKYNQKFRVVGGGIPGVLSDEYWITAEACEGEYAGVNFDVYYEGENGCWDGYITILKQEEACEALKKLIQGEFPEVQVFASLNGEYGNEVTLDMTGEQLLEIVEYNYEVVFSEPGMTKEEFIDKVNKIGELLKFNNVLSTGTGYYFEEKVDSNMSEYEFLELVSGHTDTNLVYIWRASI